MFLLWFVPIVFTAIALGGIAVQAMVRRRPFDFDHVSPHESLSIGPSRMTAKPRTGDEMISYSAHGRGMPSYARQQRDLDHAAFAKGFEAVTGSAPTPGGVIAVTREEFDTLRNLNAHAYVTTFPNAGKMVALLAVAAVSLLALSACGNGPTPAQEAQITAGFTAGVTLASIAAEDNTTVAKVIAKGALFCQSGGSVGVQALTFAVVTSSRTPISVANQTAQAVAQTCAALNAVPVPPPADAATVPVQVAPTTTLPPIVPPAAQSFYVPAPGVGVRA